MKYLGKSNSNEDFVNNKKLNTALSTKANSEDLSTVATTGDYNDLSNKPIIAFSYSNGTLTITCQEDSLSEE